MNHLRGGRILILTFAASALAGVAKGRDWPGWRGPQRDGVSQETGLLREWPKAGPKLLWRIDHTGSGYSTPAVVGDRLYLLANEGLENEFVEALAVQDGKRIWSTRLGNVGNPKQQPNFPAARSTPSVDGESLYALSSDGDLACLETATGKARWRKNLRTDFGGKPGDWAYAESPLIDGEALVCTPGGSQAALVALKKRTGEVLWKCAVPGDEAAAYTSAIVMQIGGRKQYVQMLGKGLVGVAANDGSLLWRYNRTVSRYGATIPTPLPKGDLVYSAGAGTGGGLAKLKPKEGKVEVEEVYFSPKLPTAIGGIIRLGEWLYGTTGESLVCANFATGDLKWEDRAVGPASLCYVDQRLYLHGENGEVALVEATADGYHEKGRFSPPGQPAHPNQMEKAWAYPVVANGRLYLRDHGVLWCYDVRNSATN